MKISNGHSIFQYNDGYLLTIKKTKSTLVEWSACLITNQETAGWIPGASTLLKSVLSLGRGPPSLVRTIR